MITLYKIIQSHKVMQLIIVYNNFHLNEKKAQQKYRSLRDSLGNILQVILIQFNLNVCQSDENNVFLFRW